MSPAPRGADQDPGDSGADPPGADPPGADPPGAGPPGAGPAGTGQPGPPLGVEYVECRPVPIVRLTGELDLASAGTLQTALDSIGTDDRAGIVFDLSALDFMDSSGIAVLLVARERFGSVELRRPPAIIRQVIEMTGLAGTFRIVE